MSHNLSPDDAGTPAPATSEGSRPTLDLAGVVAGLDERYPQDTAEDWDAVGLVVGDPSQPVRRVMFAVDPVDDVVAEAIEWGADLLVTHHPLFLKGVHSVAATTYKGALVHRLIRAGCALYVAHTNADAADRGVAHALADALGLVDSRPLVPAPGPSGTDEPADDGAVSAERAEPIGLGRVGRLASPVTLGEFARVVAAALPATAQGIRVAGDLEAPVATIAVLGGSGESLFGAVRGSGADVYVTSDLKHHGVSELREQVDFEAGRLGGGRPFIIDTAHFASEWPWLELAAHDLVSEAASKGTTVEARVSTRRTDPWTAVFPSNPASARTDFEKGSSL